MTIQDAVLQAILAADEVNEGGRRLNRSRKGVARLGLAAAAGLLLAWGAAVRPAGADAALLRTAITVADVERSRDFYALLGFETETEMGGERNPDSSFPLNSRSSRWRLVVLESARAEGGRIGLLSFADEAPVPARPVRRDEIGLGDIVFVLDVPDARAVHARLAQAGAAIVEEPFSYTSRQLDASGKPMTGWVFHVFDPDGYLVEILEAPR